VNVLLYLAEAFFVAYLMRWLARRLKLPAVSGYVVGGVVLGGTFFVWHPHGQTFTEQFLFTVEILDKLESITQIALGMIALTIGIELGWRSIRQLGRSVLYITLWGALLPFVLVAGVTWLFWRDTALALTLGAVASATAPTATVAVIQQYKAKGPLTSTIMAVVGLDDAVSFILFAFTLTIAKSLLMDQAVDIMSGFLIPLKEIGISAAIGAAGGFVAATLLIRTRDQEGMIFILGALILGVSGLAMELHVSDLLANMVAGIVMVNTYPSLERRVRVSFGNFTPIFYALFFIIGGAYLDLTRLKELWALCLMFLIVRSAGKIIGGTAGATMGNAPRMIRKWVGISLLPQLGASTALALAVEQVFGSGEYGLKGIDLARTTFNIVLITTFVTEFLGPYLTRRSLIEAGEAEDGND
jgi:Kef-type K+ transport system membrane component KefB